MDQSTQNTIRAAEEVISRLVAMCRNPGPLYARSPKAVAQVSRTGKWCLNAMAALQRELRTPKDNDDKQGT